MYFTDIQAWANNKKYEYEYNDEGRIDKVHFFMGTPWQSYYFEKYFYYPNGKIDKIECITSNGKIKGDYLYRRTYNYDIDNILLSITDDKYMSGAWVFDYGVNFTYDDNKENIIAKETSSGFKFTYDYDNTINITDVTAAYYHYFDDYMISLFKHPVVMSEAYSFDWGEWEKSTVKTFIYKLNMDKIDNHNTNKGFKIYPNPVSENYFTIDMDADYEAHMTIMDAKATVVSCKKVRNAEQINISSLNNGIYIVQLVADGLAAIQKIIISR